MNKQKNVRREILIEIIQQTRYHRDFQLLPRTNAHGQRHQSALNV
mgnify:FL=1